MGKSILERAASVVKKRKEELLEEDALKPRIVDVEDRFLPFVPSLRTVSSCKYSAFVPKDSFAYSRVFGLREGDHGPRVLESVS